MQDAEGTVLGEPGTTTSWADSERVGRLEKEMDPSEETERWRGAQRRIVILGASQGYWGLQGSQVGKGP